MIILLALLAGADPAPPAAHPVADPNKIICRDIGQTGSRLARNRICMTRAQWDERERRDQGELKQLQANMPNFCPPRTECQ